MTHIKKAYRIIFLLCCCLTALSSTHADQPPYNQMVYSNPTIGIAISGPAGWFLTMKDNPGVKTAPMFQGNPSLFALFSSIDIEHAIPAPNSIGLISVFFKPKDESATDPDNKQYTDMLPPTEKLIEPPHIVTFNEQPWLVMRTSIGTGSSALAQVTYITNDNQSTIHIEAVTSESMYQERRKLFDEMIGRVVFGHDQAGLAIDAVKSITDKK